MFSFKNIFKNKPDIVAKKSAIQSPLAWRLMLLNILAPTLLVAGLLYMDHYQKGLIDAEIKVLKVQAELMAVAISEGAVISELLPSLVVKNDFQTEENGYFHHKKEQKKITVSSFGDSDVSSTNAPREVFRLSSSTAGRVLRRFSSLDILRIRLFDHNGVLSADSNFGQNNISFSKKDSSSQLFWLNLFQNKEFPVYDETKIQTAFDYPEVGAALGDGIFSSEIRYLKDYGNVLSAAVPVIYEDQIVGAIMVTNGIDNVLKNLIAFRLAIFRLFGLAFFVTILLSYFMVRTIIKPLNRLSNAATNIRISGGRRQIIPDETKRLDEIGALSGALIKMTDTLWERLDATERFATDVSHEIKNPLSSMRSAIETIDLISDEKKKQKLMNIIHQDVLRLDRLITDISNLSRLDAELSREVFEVIKIHNLLSSLIEVYNLGDASMYRGITFDLKWDDALSKDVSLLGMETRLAQVFYNLISNAISFSPDNSKITVEAFAKGDMIELKFNDEGPGIPAGDEGKLFQRFYCERPTSEQFGRHSGLGLSISEKIVTGLNGQIYAENRIDEQGNILGACFVILLPLI